MTSAINGRRLASSKEYAVAKMRLFQVFDEGSVTRAAIFLDQVNLEELLDKLGI